MIVFGPGPGPTARQAVDLQRRAGGDALADGERLLAPGGRDARRRQELLLAHVGLGDLGALGVRQRHDVVVEARHGDAVVGVVQLGQDFDQRQRRVVHRAAVEPAVQVVVRPLDLDLDVGHAAQAVGDGRLVDRRHRRVADDADIGLEQIEVRFDEGAQVGRGDLLFAFEQELQVDRRAIARLQVRLQRLDVDEELPLVVGRAAGVDLAVLDDRLERRRVPAIFDRARAPRRSGRRPARSACPAPRPATRRRRPDARRSA